MSSLQAISGQWATDAGPQLTGDREPTSDLCARQCSDTASNRWMFNQEGLELALLMDNV